MLGLKGVVPFFLIILAQCRIGEKNIGLIILLSRSGLDLAWFALQFQYCSCQLTYHLYHLFFSILFGELLCPQFELRIFCGDYTLVVSRDFTKFWVIETLWCTYWSVDSEIFLDKVPWFLPFTLKVVFYVKNCVLLWLFILCILGWLYYLDNLWILCIWS